MARRHHVLVFEGPMGRPGENVILSLSRRGKRQFNVLRKVTPDGKVELYILNRPNIRTDKKSKTKLHMIEISRRGGSQAFEVHYDVLPRLDKRGRAESITPMEIPGVQLTDEQMLELIDEIEPILKKTGVRIRWIKPGEEWDG